MTPYRIFNLMLLVMLVVAAAGLSLVKLAGSAHAAPAPGLTAVSAAFTPALRPLLNSGPVLTITKSSVNEEGTPLLPGERLTYTLVLSNSGDAPATNVVISDTVPAQTTFDPNSLQISAEGTPGTPPTLAEGITVTAQTLVTITYAVTVNSTAADGTEIVNTASATSAEIITPVSGTVTDNVVNEANLSVSKTNHQATTIPGQTVTYTIVVSNIGPSDAPDAVITDTFPASVNGVAWTCTSAAGANCPVSGSGLGNLNAPVDLPVGGLVTFTATGTIDAAATGSLVNTATVIAPVGVTDPDPNNNSTSDTDTLTPQANLSISKTDNKTSVFPGSPTTYTITIANSGPSSAPVVTVTDTFPAINNVTWDCSGSGGGTCPASGSGSLDQSVNLPAGGSVTFNVAGTVDPGARGTLTNTATLTLPTGVTDPNTTNNSATDTTTLDPQANLVLTKSDSSNTVSAGDFLTYTINIVNQGPSNRTQVQLTDNLPTAVTFLSSTPGSPTCNPNGASIVCDLATIAGGSSVSVTIRVQVKSSTPAGSILNTALVESDSDDEVDPAGNNIDNESTNIQVRPDLTISKSESADPTALGLPLTYTLHITNNGPSDAPGVVVTDTLPGGVTFGSASSSRGTCSGTSTIICNLGSMTRSATATVTIAVTPQSTGVFSNSATVGVTGSGVVDPTSDNNTTPVITTTVSRITDLAVTVADSPDPITQGNNLTYNLSVINNGPSDATSVTVTDTLPAGVTFQSVTPGGPTCSHAAGTVTCNLGAMAKNSSALVTIVVNINESTLGNIVNTANVSVTGSADPTSDNNSGTATTLVKGLQMVYLPITLKPPPTQLSVFNDNTGGNVTLTVIGTGVSCTVSNNTTQACGAFPPGNYSVQVSSACGNTTISKFYDSGPQTTRVFCN